MTTTTTTNNNNNTKTNPPLPTSPPPPPPPQLTIVGDNDGPEIIGIGSGHSLFPGVISGLPLVHFEPGGELARRMILGGVEDVTAVVRVVKRTPLAVIQLRVRHHVIPPITTVEFFATKGGRALKGGKGGSGGRWAE